MEKITTLTVWGTLMFAILIPFIVRAIEEEKIILILIWLLSILLAVKNLWFA